MQILCSFIPSHFMPPLLIVQHEHQKTGGGHAWPGNMAMQIVRTSSLVTTCCTILLLVSLQEFFTRQRLQPQLDLVEKKVTSWNALITE